MKMFNKALGALAIASLATAPALAAANPASSLSVSHATRAASSTDRDSDLAGFGIIPIIAVVAVVAAIVVVASDDSDSN